ncbi:MAG TPA: GNAT family protein [Candidatus Paceibacterota bacterium]|nr:GNAT family protein [Candidatus Paceibacterota bacterium]
MKAQDKSARHVVFLRGKKTFLRPLEEGDLPLLTRWINDPEVTRYLTAYLPQSLESEKEWFAKLKSNKNEVTLGICTLDGTLIGVMGTHHINWKDGTTTTGAFIGEKKLWGKGYGTDAKMQLLNYCFNELGLRKIMSRVIAFNGRSLAYSKHCGYVVEGTSRLEVFKGGQYWDVIDLGLFKEEWLPYWQKYQRGLKKAR